MQRTGRKPSHRPIGEALHREETSMRRSRTWTLYLAAAALASSAGALGNTPAQAVTATTKVVADTGISSWAPKTNYGTNGFFAARAQPDEAGLLRFQVSVPAGQRVRTAKLMLNSGVVGGNRVYVYATKGGWSESGVTWATAPRSGTLLGVSGAYAADSWVSWPVTSAVPATGGEVNLRVYNPTSAWMGFVTREGGSSKALYMVITTEPATSASPSGVPVPVGDRPGWRQVWSDDFSGTELGHGWGAYSGAIPSMPLGVWDPSHVVVRDGKLTLRGYREGSGFVTGGVMNTVGGQSTYGKYEVRFRMNKGNGVKYVALLWPKSGIWPGDGEIDFVEDGGGDRSSATGTVIWSDNGKDKEQLQHEVFSDFSQWHTLGVEWTPGKLVYTLDGHTWGAVESTNVPDGPMSLALQTEAGSCNQWMTCLDSSTPMNVDMEIDWVSVWAQAAR